MSVDEIDYFQRKYIQILYVNIVIEPEFRYKCFWNPIFSDDDLSEYSTATIAILSKYLSTNNRLFYLVDF
jgi:hypothetical protein